MANSNFNNIDSNQIATARQVFAVASHFARIQAKSPSEKYGLTKVFNAVLKAKASAEPKATKAPKKSSTLTQRVDSLESKMDKILEILTAK